MRSAIFNSERSEDWEAREAWFDFAHHPELVEGMEVPEALSNRNGEGAIAILPSRTRSKRHLAPHFVMDSQRMFDFLFCTAYDALTLSGNGNGAAFLTMYAWGR